MKKLFIVLIASVIVTQLIAQSPAKMSFQAVVRDANNNLATSTSVSIRISIIQGSVSGPSVYIEAHNILTNVNGLATLEIGTGEADIGNFPSIDWSEGPYFLKTETDPNGGSNFSITGISQLLSVPYAFHAQTVEEDEVDDADSDPSNELQQLSLSGTLLSLSNNGGTVTLPSSDDSGDNWGSQVIETNVTLNGVGTLANPLSVEHAELKPEWRQINNLPDDFSDNIDNVDDNDASPTNEIQVLSLNGNNLSLSNGGGTVNLPEYEADNLGNHSMSMNLATNGFVISNGGDNDGIKLSPNGNVGIGVNNPGSRLTIGGGGLAAAAIYARNTESGNLGLIGGKNWGIFGQNTDGKNIGILGHNNSGVYGRSDSAYAGYFAGNVYANGDVGIKTQEPYDPLEVNGIVFSSEGGFRFPDSTIQTTAYTGQLVTDNLGDHTAQQNVKMNGNWLSGDGDDEGIFVRGNGRVGIGDPAPTEKLVVDGTIYSKSGGIKFPDGSVQETAAVAGSGESTGDITAVNAGYGLVGGASAGAATLSIGEDVGIVVSEEAVRLDLNYTDDRYVNENQAASVSGNMLKNNSVGKNKIIPDVVSSINNVSNDAGNINLVAGDNILIDPNDTDNTITISATSGGDGDITGVTAGTGLTGGGAVGDVQVAVKVPFYLEGSFINGIIGAYNFDPNGVGVFGVNSQTGNKGRLGNNDAGVYGYHFSQKNEGKLGTETSGVYGYAENGFGVYGITHSEDKSGVHGIHNSTQNYGKLGTYNEGVYGYSENGDGIYGVGGHIGVSGYSETGDGVRGVTNQSFEAGVYGINNFSGDRGTLGGFNWGVRGRALGEDSYGVYGIAEKENNTGVYGIHNSTQNYGALGTNSQGVYGYSENGNGVQGKSTENNGVYGKSTEWYGVYGETDANHGEGSGVYGINNPTGNNGILGSRHAGVWGFGVGYGSTGVRAESANGNGVTASSRTFYGVSGITNAADKYGVVGSNTLSNNKGYLGGKTYAGYFEGSVKVVGKLEKSSGSFKIDHPLEPENKYLSHSFVESPDMMNIYNGNVVLDENGEATVKLPEWFDSLNKDFRYQLTCIGGFANVYIAEKIANNQFKIAGGISGLEVSWMVTGVRNDAYARINPIITEEEKQGQEKGKYLHPEAFGLPKEMGIGFEDDPSNEEVSKY